MLGIRCRWSHEWQNLYCFRPKKTRQNLSLRYGLMLWLLRYGLWWRLPRSSLGMVAKHWCRHWWSFRWYQLVPSLLTLAMWPSHHWQIWTLPSSRPNSRLLISMCCWIQNWLFYWQAFRLFCLRSFFQRCRNLIRTLQKRTSRSCLRCLWRFPHIQERCLSTHYRISPRRTCRKNYGLGCWRWHSLLVSR